MDFLDNLLNHMSTTFNQETTTPEQTEFSKDETLKWRALKNNQFASKSKAVRLCESSSKNKKTHKFNHLNDIEHDAGSSMCQKVVHDECSPAIEIEIGDDISGEEIGEVLAANKNISEYTQTEKSAEVSAISQRGALDATDDKIKRHGTDTDVPSDTTDAKRNAQYDEVPTSIFFHMSSTFNSRVCNEHSEKHEYSRRVSCDSKLDSTNILKPSEQCLLDNNEINNIEAHEVIHRRSVRRSKRLKKHYVKITESEKLQSALNSSGKYNNYITKDNVTTNAETYLPVKDSRLGEIPCVSENISINLNGNNNFVNEMHGEASGYPENKGIQSDERKANCSNKYDRNINLQYVANVPSLKTVKSGHHSDISKNNRNVTSCRKLAVDDHINMKYCNQINSTYIEQCNNVANIIKVPTKSQSCVKSKSKCKISEQSKNTRIGSGMMDENDIRHKKVSRYHGRLSRPIKLSAKILANDELRYGFEMQNNARLSGKLHATNAPVSASNTSTPIATLEEHLHEEIGSLSLELTPRIPKRTESFSIKKFLIDIKRQKLENNRSPENNKSLNENQYRRLLRSKEKHLRMLGLFKIRNKKTHLRYLINEQKNGQKCIDACIRRCIPGDFIKTSCKQNINQMSSERHVKFSKLSIKKIHVMKQPSTKLESVDPSRKELLCLCENRELFFRNRIQNRMYCTAIDDIDGLLMGCAKDLGGELQRITRPNINSSYQWLCQTHRKRLKNHGCCSICGVYCTQGKFAVCSRKHLFHMDCSKKYAISHSCDSTPTIMLSCPHCGLDSIRRSYNVKMAEIISPIGYQFMP